MLERDKIAMMTKNSNSRTNKTGFKGVKKVHQGSYQACLTLRISGKQYTKTLGTYSTPQEAYTARVNFIKKLI